MIYARPYTRHKTVQYTIQITKKYKTKNKSPQQLLHTTLTAHNLHTHTALSGERVTWSEFLPANLGVYSVTGYIHTHRCSYLHSQMCHTPLLRTRCRPFWWPLEPCQTEVISSWRVVFMPTMMLVMWLLLAKYLDVIYPESSDIHLMISDDLRHLSVNLSRTSNAVLQRR